MKKDWVGTWFQLLEKRGIYSDVVLGSSEPGSDQITKFKKYSHAQFDGVGLVVEHFRSLGQSPVVPTLPKIYYGSWLTKAFGLFACLRFVPVFGAHWKAISPPALISGREDIFVYQILSAEAYQKIIQASRRAGVSVNSQLLWSLDQCLRNEWVSGSGPFFWMLPINMRCASQNISDTSNHASWIWVDTLNVLTATDIQKQIQARLKEGFHWGAWISINIGKLIGIKGMNFLLNQAEKIEERWIGTFSNMGVWNIDAGPLVVIVPTAPTTPLSVGCITVNNRMGLSLNIRLNLKVEKSQLQAWLESWIKKAGD